MSAAHHQIGCARRCLGGVQLGDSATGGLQKARSERSRRGSNSMTRMMLGLRSGGSRREAKIVTSTTTDHHLERVWGRFGRSGEAVVMEERPQVRLLLLLQGLGLLV